jgi:DEAD/DEAH box helicase domain-containing protein
VRRLPREAGSAVDWPEWTPPTVRSALRGAGIERPWTHQAAAADLAHRGGDVVMATGTASGKSLGYQLPALTAISNDPRTTVLYLAPTKALAADQLGLLSGLSAPGLRPAVYDGDTPGDERDWARGHANWLLTNPDMLHLGLLPHHSNWARLWRRLAFVVVDECHAYRGVFGSHVALVLRRLVRVARLYRSDPVFVLASATSAEPAAAAGRLIGRPVRAITQDGSARPAADFVLWEPAAGADEDDSSTEPAGVACTAATPRRPSATAEAARLMADLVAGGARTLTFVRSRQGAEQVALAARRRLRRIAPELASRVAAYRGGYLPEDRRELERALDTGELLGLASTNALELGIDIAGLDAAVIAGYPGTLAALWQQAGRAGRDGASGRRALVIFVAREDPLDTYLVRHPEAVFDRPVESAVIDPTNPFVLGPHLSCAAAEHHLTPDDLDLFGGRAARSVLDQLVDRRVLRLRPSGFFWANPGHPAERVNLRGSGAGQVAIVDRDSCRLLGTVDAHRAPSSVHTGAVHLHRGESFVVDELDLDAGVAYVRADRPEWTTVPRSVSTVAMIGAQRSRSAGRGVRVGVGPVELTTQVVGYLRRRTTGEVLDQVELDLPRHTLPTRAVWYTVAPDALRAAGVPDKAVPGALHAAEHAAIGLLPLFAGCDRMDIGGLSTAAHPDTGEPTVIVYDGYPGGAGFADRGFEAMLGWLSAVRDTVADCPCDSGCPSCVQSPKCGNGNHPLDKAGAIIVLELVVDALTAERAESVGA